MAISLGKNIALNIIALIGCTPIAKNLFERLKGILGEKQIGLYSADQLIKSTVNIAIFIGSIILLVGQSYNPFLYYKF